MSTFNNLNRKTLDADSRQNIEKALSVFEETVRDILVGLTPDDCKRYGRVREQNKLFINKIYEFHKSNPELQSPDVDWEEFDNDYMMRSFIEGLLMRLERIFTGLKGAKILHDYDNYQNALYDYSYSAYKSNTPATGFTPKYQEIKKLLAHKSKQNNNIVNKK